MSTGHLDQIVFGRRESAGLVVVASSFDDERVAWWEAKLDTHIRLKQYRGSVPPAAALSYLRFDGGRAAVLRRRNEPGAAARNASHALVGSVAVLSPEVAVGLGEWSWSEAPPVDPRLEQVDGEAVTTAGLASHDRLRDEARSFADEAEIVLACLLEDPDALISIVHCPDRDRPAMLWALHSAAAAYLAAHGVDRTWTFSTYEVDRDRPGSHLPEIIFLPTTYDATDVATVGTLVNLAEPPRTASAATELARRLLDGALQGSAVDVDQLPPPPVRPAAVPEGGPARPRDHRTRSTARPCSGAVHRGTVDALSKSHRPERGRSSATTQAGRADRGPRPRTGRRRAVAGLVAAGVLAGIGFAVGSSTASSAGTVVVQGRLPGGVRIEQVGLYAVDDSWRFNAACTPAEPELWRCPLPADRSAEWVVGYTQPGDTPEVGSSRASITPLFWIATG